MNEINHEQFEAWLFSQPDERTFNYIEGFSNDETGCVMCNFLREMTSIRPFTVSYAYLLHGENFDSRIELNDWFMNMMQGRKNRLITALEAKTLYLKQFPNAIVGNTQPSAIAEKVEFVSIAQVTNGNLANAKFAVQNIK